MLYVSEEKHRIFESLLAETYRARTTQDRPERCRFGIILRS